MEPFLIPAGRLSQCEAIVKKSRFITYLAHTYGQDQARQQVNAIKSLHPAARHHCWAFVAGAPHDSKEWGCSDDGEPSGTAGKPMLAQLMGSRVGEITAVVVRYYGGIMLGTGGLVKAYGGGVQQGLRELKCVTKIPRKRYRLICHYAQLAEIIRLITAWQGIITYSDYQAEVQLLIELPESCRHNCQQQLNNLGRGMLTLIPVYT